LISDLSRQSANNLQKIASLLVRQLSGITRGAWFEVFVNPVHHPKRAASTAGQPMAYSLPGRVPSIRSIRLSWLRLRCYMALLTLTTNSLAGTDSPSPFKRL